MITVSWSDVLSICGGITCIAGAIAVIANLWKKAKSPENEQNKRLARLEERVDNLTNLITTDRRRIDKVEDGSRVTQKAILALLAHGIDGNAVDSMRAAKKDLEDYLVG